MRQGRAHFKVRESIDRIIESGSVTFHTNVGTTVTISLDSIERCEYVDDGMHNHKIVLKGDITLTTKNYSQFYKVRQSWIERKK